MMKKSNQLLRNAISMIWAFMKTEKCTLFPNQNLSSLRCLSSTEFRAVLLSTVLLSSVIVSAQTTQQQQYTTPGTFTFVVPVGTASITVEAWGSGGGAGGSNVFFGGGSGGGGAYASSVISVLPGQTYQVVVGAGGTGGAGAPFLGSAENGFNGAESKFGASLVLAAGGKGGLGSNAGSTFGAGGLASASSGTIRFSGGNGINGNTLGGVGGGSSAGNAANGNIGSFITGGVAPAGGGNGGNGNINIFGNGFPGQQPGGGGGSGDNADGVSGGAGGAGKVILTYTICSNGLNFALGATSKRCFNTAGSVTYTATATSGPVTYSLDAASLAAGNTINTSTGQVNYVATWGGPTTITASATCFGKTESITHVVDLLPIVATPVFNLGSTSRRCFGAGSVIYTATSADATAIIYSLDAISLAAGNIINASTGQVTYTVAWSGISTITATASGCGTPTATHQADSGGLFVNDDSYTTNQGLPITFNVLANDLCNIDPSTVTITQQPVGGFVTQGANGQMTYVSFGAFLGPETIKYQVCSNGPTVTCKTATVTITVLEVPDDACFQANKEKTYYLPFPENDAQLKQSLVSAASTNNLTTNVRSIVSISVPYPGTQITYDHWEDGYEADIKNPTLATTQVWGDGNTSNGVAPGYPTDIIPAGGFITIDNSFLWNRPTTTLGFDGKDKIFSNANISVSKVNGDAGSVSGTPLFNVQTVKTNVSDVTRFGNFFVLPFGENVTNGPTTAFNYTGLFVRAKDNGTVVQLDYDGNGTYDVTSPTLNEGEVWFYNGVGSTPGVATNVNNATDIKAGARVSANNPVGVDLVFGGIDLYGTRNIPVLPSQFYGTTYYSPVYSTNAAAPALAYFVNPTAIPITINWSRGNGTSGSFSVPANNGRITFNLNIATGTKFVSAGGESYTAVVIMDADNTGSAYDWAFNMIPEKRLTSAALVAWAPGSSDGSANYNPVWVTPKTTTTVYVKYDGNITAGPNQAPCGGYYDVSYTVNALESKQILGLNNDNSGMVVYNCNDIPMAMVWGQNSETSTPAGSPAIDVGYTMEPKCFAKIVFAVDDKVVTPQNTAITINVAGNDKGFLVVLDTTNTTALTQPTNGTIVKNADGSFTYLPNAGFTGQDSFTYTICGQSPENTTCDVATVYISVPCAIVVDANVIAGTVFTDLNNNGTPNSGESGISAINVELYDDVNKNGVLDTGEPLLQTKASVAGASAGSFQFNIPNSTYLDQFNTNASASGSDGTITWSTSWAEILEANGFGTGNIQVVGNKLRIQGNGATTQVGALRTADLSNVGEAELTFDYAKSAFTSSTNDWVDVQIASSASGPWVTLARYSGTAAATGSQTFSMASGFISTATTIRFIESTNAGFINTKSVDFDNIKIRYVKDKKYIVKLATPIGNDWEQTSTPVTTVVDIKNFSDDNCSTKFGLKKQVCYEAPTDLTTLVPVNHGITILKRAGADNGEWPMVRNSAYTALESKTKGFVVTRNANPETTIANPVIGMMVFDTDADSGKGCLKINTDGTSTGWKCFNVQTCP